MSIIRFILLNQNPRYQFVSNFTWLKKWGVDVPLRKGSLVCRCLCPHGLLYAETQKKIIEIIKYRTELFAKRLN